MPKMTIRQLNNELLNPSGPQIDVRDVFTPGDGTTWQDLPFFPAYQLSSTNHVRTFNKKKNFPYGAICRYRQTSNGIIYNIKDATPSIIVSNIFFTPYICYEYFNLFVTQGQEKDKMPKIHKKFD